MVLSVVQLWALYCLILFYSGTKDELAPIRPLSKFIVVKSVVFLSYWQGVLIAILVATGVIKSKACPFMSSGTVPNLSMLFNEIHE